MFDEDEWDEFDEFEDEDVDEFEDESEPALGEDEEEELALELLELSSDEELEEFLGALLKGAARAAGGFLKSTVGKKLLSSAKRVAKSALPKVGSAIGGHFGGSAGKRLGRSVGRFAASRLEHDELEMAAAKKVIRTTYSAAKSAVKGQTKAPPAVVAKQAMARAVTKHQPMAVRHRISNRSFSATSGRWRRRGRRIVLLGL